MSTYSFNYPISHEEERLIWKTEPLTTQTLENVTSKYLPLTGGAFTGTIQLNSGAIVFPDNSKQTVAYTADRDTARYGNLASASMDSLSPTKTASNVMGICVFVNLEE
jgi:hypothetical protein